MFTAVYEFNHINVMRVKATTTSAFRPEPKSKSLLYFIASIILEAEKLVELEDDKLQIFSDETRINNISVYIY